MKFTVQTNQPLVSVVALNFNNSGYVLQTLDSIAAQTYSNTELLVVDDCSTDDSPSKIEEWLQSYKRDARFIRHPANRGICGTANSGYRLAAGKYVCYIATDDCMMPEKIERQVQILETTGDDVAAVYSDAYMMEANGKSLYGWFIQRQQMNFAQPPSGNLYDLLLEGNFIPAMSMMFKRKIFDEIGYFDESLGFEDYDMWLRIARKYQLLFSDYVSARYRVRPNSLSSYLDGMGKSAFSIMAKHLPHPIAQRNLRMIAFELYKRGDPRFPEYIRKYMELTGHKPLSFKVASWHIPYKIAYLFSGFIKKD